MNPSSKSAEGIDITLTKMLPLRTTVDEEVVFVSLTAKNVAASAPIAVSTTSFTLATTEALLVIPAPESLTIKHPCTAGALLDTGGTLSCVVAFRTKPGTAKDLVYRLPSGASLRVPLPPSECNVLAQRGTAVPAKSQATVPSVGGLGDTAEVPNGVFVLTKVITTATNFSMHSATTLRVSDGRYEMVYSEGTKVSLRLNGSIAASSADPTLPIDCQWSADRGRIDGPDDTSKSVLATEHHYVESTRTLMLLTETGDYDEYSLTE